MAKILVVDDEPVVQTLLQATLERRGADVCVAATAAEAGALLTAGAEFDVALVDKNLPDRPGMDVVRWLRDAQPLCEIIVITGYPSRQSAKEAFQLGVYEYMVKPFGHIRDVVDRVDGAYEKSRMRRAQGGGQAGKRDAVEDS